jgi:hypothetical protein
VADFVGFVGPSYIAASIIQDDQECINLYPEADPTKFSGSMATGAPEQRGVIALYPTPGLLLQKALPQVAQVRALWTLPGGTTLLAVCGNQLYSLDAAFNVTTPAGTLSTNTGPVSMTDNGISAYLVDGPNRYTYGIASGTFATVALTDGAFTGGDKVDIVDNFLVYNNPGTQQYGNTNASSTVSGATNFASADSAPDNLKSLIVINRDLWLISEKHTEVWTDAGLFPVPFQRLAGTSQQHGTPAPFSVARLGESFAMLSQDTRGNGVVVMMKGYQPQRISTHAVETAIAGYSKISDAIAYTYQQAGHEFYVLTFPTADVTWCYDLATELWHKRAYRDANNVLHRHRSNCCALFQGNIIVGDFENGNLYSMSQSTYTDNGAVMPCIRRTPHLTSDLKRQFFHDLQIQFQPGVGLPAAPNPQAMLKWSDDGGFTWSNEHWTSIGRVGKYKNRAIWRRLGTARDRIFEVQVTDPVFRAMVSAELNATAAVH